MSISRWFGMMILVGITSVARAEASQASLVLSEHENGIEPQQEFFCDGKIHGYIRLPDPATGKHVLEGIWEAPDGREKAHSRSTVDFPPPGRSTAYIWFAFPPRPGLLNGPDPALDAERRDMAGSWQVSVRWDDQTLVQSSFTVVCH
jgi:hypothetical protein